MKKILILSVVFGGMWFGAPVFAQELASAEGLNKRIYAAGTENEMTKSDNYRWEFLLSVKEDFSAEDYQQAVKTGFGKELGCLIHLYETSTVKKEQVVEGDPTIRTMILKPTVYNSVKNIEKYYKRRLKSDSFSEIDREAFEHVMKVAISSLDTEETEEFEQALQETKKDPEKQIAVFQSVLLTSVY